MPDLKDSLAYLMSPSRTKLVSVLISNMLALSKLVRAKTS
jgi:hypothetical protein